MGYLDAKYSGEFSQNVLLFRETKSPKILQYSLYIARFHCFMKHFDGNSQKSARNLEPYKKQTV